MVDYHNSSYGSDSHFWNLMLILNPALLEQGWMHTKLAFVVFLLIYHFIFGILFHNFNRNFTPDKVMNPIGHPLFDRNMLVGFILPFVSNPLIHELLQPINDEAHCLFDSLGNLDVNHLVNILKIVLH